MPGESNDYKIGKLEEAINWLKESTARIERKIDKIDDKLDKKKDRALVVIGIIFSGLTLVAITIQAVVALCR